VEEAGELAVDDRRPDLGLDVVADDRQAGVLEALVPVVLAGDEDRQAVDEADAGGESLLDVPLGRLLGTNRQVADDTSVWVSCRIPTMSAVWPGALVIFSFRYLPSPSWVMPRSTLTPVFGTSANLIVLF